MQLLTTANNIKLHRSWRPSPSGAQPRVNVAARSVSCIHFPTSRLAACAANFARTQVLPSTSENARRYYVGQAPQPLGATAALNFTLHASCEYERTCLP